MWPQQPWDRDFKPEIPEITLTEAVIGPLAHPSLERPFVVSAIRHLFEGLPFAAEGTNLHLPEGPMAIPNGTIWNRNRLVVISAHAITAMQFKALENANATILLYTLKLDGEKDAKRYVRFDANIFIPNGVYRVLINQTDSLYEELPKHFTAPRAHISFERYGKGCSEPQGIHWKALEQPKKPKAKAKAKTKAKTHHGVTDAELT